MAMLEDVSKFPFQLPQVRAGNGREPRQSGPVPNKGMDTSKASTNRARTKIGVSPHVPKPIRYQKETSVFMFTPVGRKDIYIYIFDSLVCLKCLYSNIISISSVSLTSIYNISIYLMNHTNKYNLSTMVLHTRPII